MFESLATIGNLAAVFLSGLFGLFAVLHLAAPPFVVRAYQRWRFPRAFHYVAGSAMALTAIFLGVSETRIWGVILGAMILFVAIVSLLNRGKFGYAFPAMLLMAALPAAVL
jgi:hypothetical protein